MVNRTLRNKNFKIQNEVVERGAVSKGHEGHKPFVEQKVGEWFQLKAKGTCSKGESCSFRQASGNRCECQGDTGNASSSRLAQVSGNRWDDQWFKEQSSSPAPKSKAKNDVQASNSQGERLAKKMRNVSYFTKLNQDAVMADVANSNIMMLKRHPARSRRKRVVKDQLLFWFFKKVQIGCVSQYSYQKKSILRKIGNFEIERVSEAQREILRRHQTEKNSGKKKAVSRNYPIVWAS